MTEEFRIKFQPLFKVTSYLIILMIILIPIQIFVYIYAPPPSTALELFELFHQSPLLGLLSLDFLYIINNIIIIVIYLALFILLYHEKPTTSLLALTFGLIGNACYYSTNPAFEMLSLSKKYFQAQADQLNIYLGAGEALIASYTGTAFDVYYIIGGGLALILFSTALLKSPNIKKSIGVWGMLSGIFMLIPSSAGLIGMIFAFISLIPWTVFIVLLMIKFKELSHN